MEIEKMINFIIAKPGEIQIKAYICKNRNKIGWLCLCFDTKYKNKDNSLMELCRAWISIKTVIEIKRLKRVEKYLLYKANKKIKELNEKHNMS